MATDPRTMGDYLQFHPISEVYPVIGGLPWYRLRNGRPIVINGATRKEWREFVMSIRTKGLLVPILLWDGKLLDGRNRYMACLEANVEPQYVEIADVVEGWADLTDTEKYETAEEVVLHMNTRRNHKRMPKRGNHGKA